MKMYVINEYSGWEIEDEYIVCVCRTRKIAEKICNKDGFIFENERFIKNDEEEDFIIRSISETDYIGE